MMWSVFFLKICKAILSDKLICGIMPLIVLNRPYHARDLNVCQHKRNIAPVRNPDITYVAETPYGKKRQKSTTDIGKLCSKQSFVNIGRYAHEIVPCARYDRGRKHKHIVR